MIKIDVFSAKLWADSKEVDILDISDEMGAVWHL